MKSMYKAMLGAAAALAAAAVLVACGGSDAPAAGSASTTITGAAVKGPVNGATVNVYRIDAGGVKGALLATTTTGAGGSYSVTLTGYTGDVLIEVTGGTYTDEATGATRPLAETMRVATTSGSEGGTITGIVTPLTTAAYSLGQVGGSGGVTIATYGAALNSIAAQFNLSAINLVTTMPAVTGTTNAYGQMLRAVSQYVANGGTLNTFLNWTSPSSFQVAFSNAYGTINGTPVTFTFNANGVTISGSGAGGGSGTCGVAAHGTATVGGTTVPIDFNYCVNGIAAGSCSAGNSSLSQGLSAAGGATGAVNLTYTYSASCAAGATIITLK
ncbi:MAG: hypothetical protein H7346_27535 [Burkholderiaceae bacterium]|nr:hypothetical protein [Burkholderiaceae bacterium]